MNYFREIQKNLLRKLVPSKLKIFDFPSIANPFWHEVVLENALDAVVGMDQDGIITDWNKQAVEIFGWTKAEAIGRKLSETIVPAKHQKYHLEGMEYFLKTGDGPILNRHIQTEAIHRTKGIFPIELTIIPLKKTNGYIFYSFVRDLTEQNQGRAAIEKSVRLNEALIASEARFRTLFEQAPFSVQLVTPDGRTIQVNEAWKKLLDVSDELVENFVLKEYKILEDPQLEKKGMLPYIQKAFAGQAAQTPPIRYDPAELGKPGRARWLEAFMYPVKDANGKLTEIVMIHEDVTERMERDAERNGLLDELKEAVRARDEFLSIASHELKTPLTSLKLYAQTQRRRFEKSDVKALDRESVAKLIDLTERQVSRLAKLVEDMFDISRITHGGLHLQIELVDLSKLSREVVDRLDDQLKSMGCECQLDTVEDCFGQWDPFRLEQVLLNLLTNAMKYGKGHPIEISICKVQDSHAIFTISDHGIGIDEKDYERIFHRFERAVSKNDVSGLGLGLYISKQIIEALGGSIAVQSKIGQGSIFTMTLPLYRSGQTQKN